LVRTSKEDKIKSKGEKRSFYVQEDYSGMKGQNISMKDFVIQGLAMANYRNPLPLIDGTNCMGNIDVELDVNLKDLKALRQALAKYDLYLLEQERFIPMVVVSETKE
jgi:hypothetical protein